MAFFQLEKPSKTLRKLFARPFKRNPPSTLGRAEEPISPIPFPIKLKYPSRQEYNYSQSPTCRGRFFQMLQKAIAFMNPSAHIVTERDSTSDHGDVIDISPCFIERAQEPDAPAMQNLVLPDNEVRSVALERNHYPLSVNEPSLLNDDSTPSGPIDVSLIGQDRPYFDQNYAEVDEASKVVPYDADPFPEDGNSYYEERLTQIVPAVESVNSLNFFMRSNNTFRFSKSKHGLNRTAVHRLLPLDSKAAGPLKKTLSEGSPFFICSTVKDDRPSDHTVVSCKRSDSSVSASCAFRRKRSVSKYIVKLSSTPRYSMDINGEPVRRPKGKARIQRLHYIHQPTLPMTEEEDITDFVMEETPDSSASVADSASLYSQDSYVSRGESVSSPELINNDSVDSEEYDDLGQLYKEASIEAKAEYHNDGGTDDGDDTLFSEVSAAIARSRARRHAVYGKKQLYARTYAEPLLAIIKDSQEVRRCGSSRTGLRPILLPISVSLRNDIGGVV